MTEQKSPTDLIMQFLDQTEETDGTSFDPAKELLQSLAAQLEAVAGQDMDPEQLAQINALLDNTAQMHTMIGQVEAAQAAGDWAKADELAQTVAAMGGAPMTREPLDPPYDALQEAIEDADITAVRKVLMRDAPDLNVRMGPYGMTPLLDALHTDMRSAEMVKVLLDHGADASFGTDDGYTPLHAIGDYMWRHEDYDIANDQAIAELLVASGADLEARDSYRLTPLLRAINCGVPAEVAALLAAGADANTTSPDDSLPACNAGKTALMSAAADPEVAQLLLDHGADPKARDAHGRDVFAVIDELLADETPDDYTPFYDGLRQTRAAIETRSKLN